MAEIARIWHRGAVKKEPAAKKQRRARQSGEGGPKKQEKRAAKAGEGKRASSRRKSAKLAAQSGGEDGRQGAQHGQAIQAGSRRWPTADDLGRVHDLEPFHHVEPVI